MIHWEQIFNNWTTNNRSIANELPVSAILPMRHRWALSNHWATVNLSGERQHSLWEALDSTPSRAGLFFNLFIYLFIYENSNASTCLLFGTKCGKHVIVRFNSAYHLITISFDLYISKLLKIQGFIFHVSTCIWARSCWEWIPKRQIICILVYHVSWVISDPDW